MEADNAKATIAIPTGQFWLALVAVGGLAGTGSFLGVSSVDNQPSERLARLEQALANLELISKDTRDAVSSLNRSGVNVDSRISALEWRIGLCEERVRREKQNGGAR